MEQLAEKAAVLQYGEEGIADVPRIVNPPAARERGMDLMPEVSRLRRESLYLRRPVYDFMKRIMDIVCSLIGLVVLLPLFIAVAAAIIIDDPGNPFFVQKRTGRNGKEFHMLKFRSMYKDSESRRKELLARNEADGPIFKLKEDPRVTKVGRFIRRSSIDELPQLLNIVSGSMSVVGPRPLPTYEQAGCNEYQAQRLLVKPGLSCYWQVSGRSNTSFDELIELDLKYIRERGILTDIKIIFMTAEVVMKSKGAY